MLKGLKSKPKPSELDKKALEEEKSSGNTISELIKEEKAVSSNEYHRNLLKNLKQHDDEPGEIQEITKDKGKKVQSLVPCDNCLDSNVFSSHLLISIEDSFHLSLPPSGPLIQGHLLISPNYHVLNSLELELDEQEHLLNLKQKVIGFYQERYNKKALFTEFVRKLDECSHLVIECFPVSSKVCEDIYFTVIQELNEADDEWADNKKIIQFTSQSLEGNIPKGFPYVYFDFSMEKGLAHVIENWKKFKPDFVKNMVAESLGIELLYVRKKSSMVSLQLLQKDFEKKWKTLNSPESTAN